MSAFRLVSFYSFLSTFTAMSLTLLLLALCIPCVILTNLKTTDNYGPYVAIWDKFNVCHGPKRMDATKMSTLVVEDDGKYIGYMNITYLQPTRFDEVRAQISVIKEGKKSTLWTYKINNPCKHMIFEEILQKEYDISKDCLVSKGSYFYKFNFADLWTTFAGKTFFYGEYWVKTVAVSKTANICCLNFRAKFVKPT